MAIDREDRNGVAVVRLTGRLDATNSGELERLLVSIVLTPRSTVVVDLSGLRAMTSAGLRSLLVAAKRARGATSRIVLADIPASVRELLDASGFSALFETHASLDSALKR